MFAIICVSFDLLNIKNLLGISMIAITPINLLITNHCVIKDLTRWLCPQRVTIRGEALVFAPYFRT